MQETEIKPAGLLNQFTAQAKAQGEIKPAKLDMKNPHYNSSYASLTSVQDSYRDILPKYGLSIIQQVSSIDARFNVQTTLAHASGESLSSNLSLILDRNNMQGLGSAITYARRYSICAMLGIVDTEDDDGNAAVASKPEPIKPQAKPVVTKVGAKKDDEAEKLRTIFYNMVTEYNISDPQGLIKEVIGTVKKSSALSLDELKQIIAVIEKRAKA